MTSYGRDEWLGAAACAEVGGDFWFADPITSEAREAINICRTCPSQAPCADEAIQMISQGFPIFGIWGGLHRRDLEHLSWERHGKVRRRGAT